MGLDQLQCQLIHLQSTNLDAKRKQIYTSFLPYQHQVWKMSSTEIQKLVQMYDQLFLDGQLFSFLAEKNYTLEFKTAGRDQFTTDGTCMLGKCRYLITLPIDKFKGVSGEKLVAGHHCKDQLECLLRVVEHEFIHLLIFVFCWDQKLSNEHAELFTDIAKRLFNHSDIYHYIF